MFFLFENSPTKWHRDSKYITKPESFTDIDREGYYNKLSRMGIYDKEVSIVVLLSPPFRKC